MSEKAAKRGRPRHWARFETDLKIHGVLRNGEPGYREAPGEFYLGSTMVPRFKSVSEAAVWLSEYWASFGYHMSPATIRARYNLLKKACAEYEKADFKADEIPEQIKKRL